MHIILKKEAKAFQKLTLTQAVKILILWNLAKWNIEHSWNIRSKWSSRQKVKISELNKWNLIGENNDNPSLPLLLLYYTCPNKWAMCESVTNKSSNSKWSNKKWESFWQNEIKTDSMNSLKYQQKHTNYVLQNKVKASMKPK